MAAKDDVKLEERSNKTYAVNSNSRRTILLKYEETIEFTPVNEKNPEKPRKYINSKSLPAASSVELGPRTFYDKQRELQVIYSYDKISAKYVKGDGKVPPPGSH